MAVLELLILSHDIHQQMSSADLLLLISVTHTHTHTHTHTGIWGL